MARKFVTTREFELIDSWNRELIQDVVEQEILYYAVSEESQVHDTYDEAIKKVWYDPIKINARVRFSQGPAIAKGGHLDSTYSIDVQLHRKECEERNIKPREGDFIEYGQIIYEITSLGNDQPVFGQINNKLKVSFTCVPSREGQFKVENSTAEGIDNTHPVEDARPRTLGDDL